MFDYDGNNVITKDEMIIMCISFMRGIKIMTQTAHEKITDSETLAEQAFHLADSSPDGQITCDEYFLFRLYN